MGAQNNCFLMEQGLTNRVGEQEAEVLWTTRHSQLLPCRRKTEPS